MNIIENLTLTDKTDIQHKKGSIYEITADGEKILGGRNFDTLTIKGKTIRIVFDSVKYKYVNSLIDLNNHNLVTVKKIEYTN